MASATYVRYDDGYRYSGVNGVINFDARNPQEYRHLQFLKPTTGDLNTWLQSNAIKMPLSGTWVFNTRLGAGNAPGACNISFMNNGTSYSKLEVSASAVLSYGDSNSTVYDGSKWGDAAYRTITFTQPVKYEGNEEFVRWFVDNAAPPPMIENGTYVFRDITPSSGGTVTAWGKGSTITQSITAMATNYDMSSIVIAVGSEKTSGDSEIESGYNIESIWYTQTVNGQTANVPVFNNAGWAAEEYKTIEITEDCIVDEKFKAWFDYYTTKQ